MSALTWVLVNGRVTPLSPGWGPLTGHRMDEAWHWRLLNRQDQILGTLDGVNRGSLNLNVNAQTRGTGNLSWEGEPGEAPPWRDVRVQPVYTATLQDGSTVSWPMGVYLCATPESVYTDDGLVSVDVQLFDKTLILRRNRLSSSSGVLAGTPVIPHVRSILDSKYGGRHAIEDSDATLRSSMVWDPGTSWLTIANDLLTAAGHFALWADGDGVLRSGAYIRPQDRPLVWEFTDGTASIYEDGFTHTQDDFDVPNRVTLISSADGETPALRSQVRLEQIYPGHPWSEPVTGERIDRTETDVEVTSQAVLDTMAERLMREAVQVTSDVELVHAPIPLGLLDRVRFAYRDVLDLDAVVQTMSIDCSPGADWSTSVREVAA